MNENRVVSLRQEGEIDDPLTEILRSGARKLIVQAVEVEFDAFLSVNADLVLLDGRPRVVRRGHDPVCTIQTGIGPVDAQEPEARDRGAPEVGERIRFSSSILPKWAWRTKPFEFFHAQRCKRDFLLAIDAIEIAANAQDCRPRRRLRARVAHFSQFCPKIEQPRATMMSRTECRGLSFVR